MTNIKNLKIHKTEKKEKLILIDIDFDFERKMSMI